MGGDDYLTKPFAVVELVARIEALLRRPAESRETTLRVGPLALDLIERTAKRGDRLIDLLPREFRLLEYMMQRSDQLLTRAMRLDAVITVELASIAGRSPERRLEAIDEKLRQDPGGVQVAAIFAAAGHRIAGNLESLPPHLRIDAPAQGTDVVRTDRNSREHQVIRAIGRRMRNGDVLILGRNVDEAGEISHVVGQTLALGLLPGFCLCLLAGAWLSVRAQQRVAEVNQRVQRIIAGDLRERLPHRNVDEPFSRLAGIVNCMLDEMETLIHALAGVR